MVSFICFSSCPETTDSYSTGTWGTSHTNTSAFRSFGTTAYDTRTSLDSLSFGGYTNDLQYATDPYYTSGSSSMTVQGSSSAFNTYQNTNGYSTGKRYLITWPFYSTIETALSGVQRNLYIKSSL